MKRIFNTLLCTVSLVATSCTTAPTELLPTPEKQHLSFQIHQAEPSRITYNYGEKYSWEDDDLLGIYIASARPTLNARAAIEMRDEVAYCNAETESYNAGDALYVYYPYSRDNAAASASAVHLVIPDIQIQECADNFNAYNMPMVGQTTIGAGKTTVTLKPLGGLLCFDVYASDKYAGEELRTITYLTDRASCGSFVYNLTNESLAPLTASSDIIEANLETPHTILSAASKPQIIMAIAPGEYSGILQITTDKAEYTYDYSRHIERNKYYTVRVNLATCTDRTSLGSEEPTSIEATLTYDEAKQAGVVKGYGNEESYTNDYGTWIICAYNYGSAFQLNSGKVAYIGTPEFDANITEVRINTEPSYTGNVLICTGKTADTEVLSQKGGGSSTVVDVADLALKQLYIRAGSAMRITDLTIVCNGQAVPGAPRFTNLRADVMGASSGSATDGMATLSCVVEYRSDLLSIAQSGIAYKSANSTNFTKINITSELANPTIEAKNLGCGTYDYYAYVIMSNGETYESEHASFVIRALSVTPTQRYAWFELPVQIDNDRNGIDDVNPDLYYSHTFRADAPTIRNFSAGYSKGYKHPVWVAAPMHSCYLGSSGRNDSYKDDPNIKCTQTSKFTGYTRGHMVGSSDRTVSVPTNKQAFYYSNIGAQLSSGFNTGGGAWNMLEDKVDSYLCTDTLYQVIGVVFDTWTDRYNSTVERKTGSGSDGEFQVPTAWYKVLLRTKKGNSGKRVDECSRDELQCVAFILAHRSNQKHAPSKQDMYTVEEVERLTGLSFFPNVPNAPKDTYTASDWDL